MRKTVRLLFLFGWTSVLSFAGTWFGSLVDSKCFESQERNVNPKDTLLYVDRDQNSEIRYCSPRAKTKSFRIVQPSGESYKLDAAGNAKATELLQKTPRRQPRYYVTVGGEMANDTVKVDSIALMATYQ